MKEGNTEISSVYINFIMCSKWSKNIHNWVKLNLPKWLHLKVSKKYFYFVNFADNVEKILV